jgi:hypothetical protein
LVPGATFSVVGLVLATAVDHNPSARVASALFSSAFGFHESHQQ